MTVILVRHGESEGNAAGIIQGWLDTELTLKGQEQARAARTQLAEMPIQAVYASPLKRAYHTGLAIAQAHDLEIIAEADLREQRWGLAEGKTWAEATAKWNLKPGTDWASLIPEMEPNAVLRMRSYECFKRIADRHVDELVVCATHGGVIIQLLAEILELDETEWPRVRVLNGGLTTVTGNSKAFKLEGINVAAI